MQPSASNPTAWIAPAEGRLGHHRQGRRRSDHRRQGRRTLPDRPRRRTPRPRHRPQCRRRCRRCRLKHGRRPLRVLSSRNDPDPRPLLRLPRKSRSPKPRGGCRGLRSQRRLAAEPDGALLHPGHPPTGQRAERLSAPVHRHPLQHSRRQQQLHHDRRQRQRCATTNSRPAIPPPTTASIRWCVRCARDEAYKAKDGGDSDPH